MKPAQFTPLALAFAMLGLAACGSRQPSPAPAPSAAPAKQTPVAAIPAEGISISDPRLVLPAVPGNPGAVYFTVHNDSGSQATLTGAEVDGAKSALLHDMSMVGGHMEMQEAKQMGVPARGELVLAPGGRHVMAMHLDDSLKPGGTTKVTLSFASGEQATFPAEILSPGNAH